MSNKLVDLQHISKSYGDNLILDDLSLYIRENEFIIDEISGRNRENEKEWNF